MNPAVVGGGVTGGCEMWCSAGPRQGTRDIGRLPCRESEPQPPRAAGRSRIGCVWRVYLRPYGHGYFAATVLCPVVDDSASGEAGW